MSTSGKPETVDRDGRSWRLGGAETVAWIARNCRVGLTITSAIPPCFDRYATITDMEDFGSPQELLASQRRLVEILRQHGSTEWWLGYLDTGAGDLVFPGAPKLSLYAGWRYVVVQAGPEQALRWRESLPERSQGVVGCTKVSPVDGRLRQSAWRPRASCRTARPSRS